VTNADATQLFADTAAYYARYRPAYPADLITCLTEAAAHAEPARLLDLGCGTGELAIPLAARMAGVDAVDADADMLAQARMKAAQSKSCGISWHHQLAENYTSDDHRYNLVTVGAAFHWMDRPLRAARSRRWLRDGGVLAITGGNSTWNGTEQWQQVALSVIRSFLGEQRRAGAGVFREQPKRHEEILADAGFDVSERTFPTPQESTVESFLGYLYSTSFASLSVLGEQVKPFEATLREALYAHDASGRYHETLRFHCVLGRLP